jgi:phenylalanyl-tRNA synthetase beta chain
MLRGVVVGRVVTVRDHPNGAEIWLADVDLGDGGGYAQIVFGGLGKVVQPGSLVPVAPPGSWIPAPLKSSGRMKMRARSFRGQFSYGMLCSLAELGWDFSVTNQVAILIDNGTLKPGDSLDDRGDRWEELTLPPMGESFRPEDIADVMMAPAEPELVLS